MGRGAERVRPVVGEHPKRGCLPLFLAQPNTVVVPGECWDVQKYTQNRAGIRANLKPFPRWIPRGIRHAVAGAHAPCRRAAFRAVFHFGAIFSPRATNVRVQ